MQPTLDNTVRSRHRFHVAACTRRRPATRHRQSPLAPEVIALAGLSLLAASVSATSAGALQVVAGAAALAATGMGRMLFAKPVVARARPAPGARPMIRRPRACERAASVTHVEVGGPADATI